MMRRVFNKVKVQSNMMMMMNRSITSGTGYDHHNLNVGTEKKLPFQPSKVYSIIITINNNNILI